MPIAVQATLYKRERHEDLFALSLMSAAAHLPIMIFCPVFDGTGLLFASGPIVALPRLPKGCGSVNVPVKSIF
jgi:hypothetical protein